MSPCKGNWASAPPAPIRAVCSALQVRVELTSPLSDSECLQLGPLVAYSDKPSAEERTSPALQLEHSRALPNQASPARERQIGSYQLLPCVYTHTHIIIIKGSAKSSWKMHRTENYAWILNTSCAKISISGNSIVCALFKFPHTCLFLTVGHQSLQNWHVVKMFFPRELTLSLRSVHGSRTQQSQDLVSQHTHTLIFNVSSPKAWT